MESASILKEMGICPCCGRPKDDKNKHRFRRHRPRVKGAVVNPPSISNTNTTTKESKVRADSEKDIDTLCVWICGGPHKSKSAKMNSNVETSKRKERQPCISTTTSVESESFEKQLEEFKCKLNHVDCSDKKSCLNKEAFQSIARYCSARLSASAV